MDSLLVLTECRSALAEAKTLDDVLAIRDKAEMIRRLLKTKGESLAAQNEMAELTARAEIMLGKALATMEKKANRHSSAPTMGDLGINPMQSHRWQTMAAAERLVARLAKQATDDGKDFTRAMVYREGRRIKDGDKPPKPPKNVGEWIAHLRKRVELVYDEAPQEFRDMMANVLRSLAENVESWESTEDGSDRRIGEETTSAA